MFANMVTVLETQQKSLGLAIADAEADIEKISLQLDALRQTVDSLRSIAQKAVLSQPEPTVSPDRARSPRGEEHDTLAGAEHNEPEEDEITVASDQGELVPLAATARFPPLYPTVSETSM